LKKRKATPHKAKTAYSGLSIDGSALLQSQRRTLPLRQTSIVLYSCRSVARKHGFVRFSLREQHV